MSRFLNILHRLFGVDYHDDFVCKVASFDNIVAELRGPDGKLKSCQSARNLVTDVGDNYLASLANGTAGWTYLMKTGSASTSATKNGAASWIPTGDFNVGSAHAMASGFPKNDTTIKKITGSGTSGTLAVGDSVISVTTEGGATPDAAAGQGTIMAVISATEVWVRVTSGTFTTGAGHYLVQAAVPATNHLDGTMTVAELPNVTTYEVLYAAGENTNTIRRACVVSNAIPVNTETDATHTLAIGVFGADIVKAAGDTLRISWMIKFLGA